MTSVDEYQAPLGDVFDVQQPRVGERLRRARVDKGLELATIAQDTRVPLRHLSAIEADAHDSLPALTYSIGFVRTFARAVGLPQDEIAAQFKAETSKTTHVPQAAELLPLDESRVPSRGVVVASGAAALLIIAGAWAWGSGVFQSDPPAPVAVAAVDAPISDTSAPAAIPPSDEQPLVSADEPAVTGDIGVAPVPAAPAAVQPPVPAAPAGQVAAGGPVVISATEDAWIKVYDRTQRATVKMGILKPGETYQVPGDRSDLLLWTGRAGALRITVGGRPVPALGGPRDTVQDVSLAPGDLLARAR